MDTDEPWGGGKVTLLAMLTENNRETIEQAVQVAAVDVASQAPF